jgi:hypothetical protein
MPDQPPSPAETATRVWAAMQAFVTSQDRNRELREAFDFGRKLVTLTSAGRDAAALAKQIMARPPTALTQLDPGDLAALDKILGRLHDERAAAKGVH